MSSNCSWQPVSWSHANVCLRSDGEKPGVLGQPSNIRKLAGSSPCSEDQWVSGTVMNSLLSATRAGEGPLEAAFSPFFPSISSCCGQKRPPPSHIVALPLTPQASVPLSAPRSSLLPQLQRLCGPLCSHCEAVANLD